MQDSSGFNWPPNSAIVKTPLHPSMISVVGGLQLHSRTLSCWFVMVTVCSYADRTLEALGTMHDPRSIRAGEIVKRVSRQSAKTRISGILIDVLSSPLGKEIGSGKAWEATWVAVTIKFRLKLFPAFTSR